MNNILNISNIAKKIKIENDIELYGNYKAKINNYEANDIKGKLILVTSTNPTPEGEGKTTLSIGLNDSLNKLGYNSVACLREPSMGPVFGSKGGATGGGFAKIIPEEDINLHFTGDMHAITSANNLLCAIIDNHIYQGNELKIKKVVFKRCLDVNDRALRHVKLENRDEEFVITPASEIMAILCLSTSINSLKERLGNIIVGYSDDNKEIFARDLNCVDALTVILKDAIKPNLVQSLYNNAVIVHGGPFANIAHGCSSLIATKYALSKFDYVITEAGFGSDMGALKFLDIKCKMGNIYPDAIVINTTIKSLKYHGNGDLNLGFDNLKYHINLMKKFNSNIIVSLNKFDTDTDEEIYSLKNLVQKDNVKFFVSSMYNDGEDGALDLAKEIVKLESNTIKYKIYDDSDELEVKVEKICKLFGASNIKYSDGAKEKIKLINESKYKNLPICIAKTPFSITDNKKILGAPKDFEMNVTNIHIQNGAGFITIYMGNILTMPGLGKNSNYKKFKI